MKPLLLFVVCCSFTLWAQSQWPEADCAESSQKTAATGTKNQLRLQLKRCRTAEPGSAQAGKTAGPVLPKACLGLRSKKPKS